GELLKEALERRAAVAGGADRNTPHGEADRLLGQEHRHLLAGVERRDADQEGDGDAFGVLEPGGEVDDDFLVCHRPGSGVVGVGCDALADLLVRPLHLRVVAVDVLAGEPEELLVVRTLQPMAAGAVDCTHRLYLLSGLYALTVVPLAPNFTALRRVSSNFERA